MDHTMSVSGVAVSGNGQVLVSSAGTWTSSSGEMKVWDGRSLELRRTITCHPVSAVAITSDGKHAITASYDYTLSSWDLSDGRCEGTFVGHQDQVEDLAVSEDGARMISLSSDGTVRLWDTKRFAEVYALSKQERTQDDDGDDDGYFVIPAVDYEENEESEPTARSVALTADGKIAVIGFSDGALRVLDVNSGAILSTMLGHTDGIEAIAVTAQGSRAITASDDGTLRVWELGTNREIRKLIHTSNYFSDVAISSDGRRAIAVSDRSLQLWDLEHAFLIAEFYPDNEFVSCAFLEPGRIVAGDEGGKLHLFRLEEPR